MPKDPAPPEETAAETLYWVASANCALGPVGSPVTAEQLAGLHVEALVEAGHLSTTDPTTDPDADPDGADAAPKGN